MPPEQRRGEAVDARADQYAFCAALREALGERSPKLGRVIARGLEPFSGDRFASMDALLAAIELRLRRRRPLVSIGIVAAAAALAALSLPRARDIVTRVIERPVIERVVEPRPSLPPVEPALDAVADDRRTPIEPANVVAEAASRNATSSVRSRASYPITDVVTPMYAPARSAPPRPTLAGFELPGGFTPIASCDDGGERICNLEEPACPPTTIAAVQAGCWTCADEHTCAPLGVPRSCNDGSKLVCTTRPPACSGHDVPFLHDGCWRCEDPFTCRAHQGAPPPPPPRHAPRCGNGVCEPGENTMSCPTDCHGSGSNTGSNSGSDDPHPVCGNGMCEIGEDHASCPSDCCEVQADGSCAPVCGNGFCETGEDHASCPADCV
jgi:hypothetical protein